MEAPVLAPEKLRPQIIQRIEAMDDNSLLLLHRLLLHVEKANGSGASFHPEAEADSRQSGKFDRLSDVIRRGARRLAQRMIVCLDTNIVVQALADAPSLSSAFLTLG